MATRKPNAPQYKKILIVTGGPNLMIVEHWTPLQKSNNDEAEWKLVPPGRKFTVSFDKGDGTPFRDNVFTGVDTVVSGPIVVEPEDPPRTYRYSVEVEGVGRIDPGIIIWDWH
ncbi:MAG: hypothetical protein JXR49_13450 [Acidobacteria bacterium]|nr:hypothetical protein [Acidobacteriota bacterium]